MKLLEKSQFRIILFYILSPIFFWVATIAILAKNRPHGLQAKRKTASDFVPTIWPKGLQKKENETFLTIINVTEELDNCH